jgi:hypothetical protein
MTPEIRNPRSEARNTCLPAGRNARLEFLNVQDVWVI